MGIRRRGAWGSAAVEYALIVTVLAGLMAGVVAVGVQARGVFIPPAPPGCVSGCSGGDPYGGPSPLPACPTPSPTATPGPEPTPSGEPGCHLPA